MIALLIQSIRVFLTLSLIVGVFYPLSVTLVGQTFFSEKANGSLVRLDNQVIASELLAQKVESPRLFWPRPSASDYGAVPSGASSQGPTSDALKAAVVERKAQGLVGVMLFSSGSGLDPHISSGAAISQLPRIVQSRNLNDNEEGELLQIIKKSTQGRDFGFLGEERINVLTLNLKLIERFGR